MNDSALNLLGLCRKAGKLNLGHDACKPSIKSGKAKLCIICADASERLKEEIDGLAGGKSIKLFDATYTMGDIKDAIGVRSAVMTVEDDGFAKAILNKLKENRSGEERDL